MREKQVEARLRKKVKEELGGLALKFTSPQRMSVPDRIILLPGGVCEFAEIKAPVKKPTDGQLREHERLRALGFTVHIMNCYEDVDGYIASKQMEEL